MRSGIPTRVTIITLIIHSIIIIAEIVKEALKTASFLGYDITLILLVLVLNIGFIIVGNRISSPFKNSRAQSTDVILRRVTNSITAIACLSLCTEITILGETLGPELTWMYCQIVYRIIETGYISIVILLIWRPKGVSILSSSAESKKKSEFNLTDISIGRVSASEENKN